MFTLASKKVQRIEGKSGESFPAEIVTFLFQFEVTPVILSQLHSSLYSSAKARAASEEMGCSKNCLMVKRCCTPKEL